MSVHAGSSRPAAKSVGAAVGGLLLTLVIFVGSFLAFLIMPLAALGVAYVAYVVVRSRSKRSGPAAKASHPASHGFGAGAS